MSHITPFFMPFARYFRLSSFSPFLLAPFSLLLSCLFLSLSLSFVLEGTSRYRQKTNAILGVVLLSVRTSANSSLRPTNRTSDCPPFSTRLPLVSRSRYPNHWCTSGSPFTFPPWRTRVKWTTSRSRRIRGSFLCFYPDVFISRIGEQVGREKERERKNSWFI